MTLTADNPTQPHLKRWTKQEYANLVAREFVDPQRTFFFRGELVEKTSAGELVPKLWTKREFIEKVEDGFLSKQRAFLFRGELIETASIRGVARVRCQTAELLAHHYISTGF